MMSLFQLNIWLSYQGQHIFCRSCKMDYVKFLDKIAISPSIFNSLRYKLRRRVKVTYAVSIPHTNIFHFGRRHQYNMPDIMVWVIMIQFLCKIFWFDDFDKWTLSHALFCKYLFRNEGIHNNVTSKI